MAPVYAIADRMNRKVFNELFYRSYRGLSEDRLIELAQPALERGEKVTIEMPIRNLNRTVGTMLSHEIAKRYGHEGLPDDTATTADKDKKSGNGG